MSYHRIGILSATEAGHDGHALGRWVTLVGEMWWSGTQYTPGPVPFSTSAIWFTTCGTGKLCTVVWGVKGV